MRKVLVCTLACSRRVASWPCARTLCHRRSPRRRLSLLVTYLSSTALPRVPTGPATLVLRGMRRLTSDGAFFEADTAGLVSIALRLLDGEADERKIARLAAMMENPDVAKVLERSKQRDAAIAKRQQEWIAAHGRP